MLGARNFENLGFGTELHSICDTGTMAATSLPFESNVAGSSKQKNKKNRTSTIGAPAQRSQASRKGKRAWRKNIDIDQVEERLEELRTEEREFGCVSAVIST